MTLHDRIMAVPVKKRAGGFDSPTELRSAIFVLKDAADLATEADELMAEMVQFVIDCDLSNNTDIREAHRILDKYNAYKEQSNEQ